MKIMNNHYLGYGIASIVIGAGSYLLGRQVILNSFLMNQNRFDEGIGLVNLSYLFFLGGGLLIAISVLTTPSPQVITQTDNLSANQTILPDFLTPKQYCEKCDTENKAEANFCSHCGKVFNHDMKVPK